MIFFSLRRKLSSFNDKGPHVSLIENLEEYKEEQERKRLVPLLPETVIANVLAYFLLLCFAFLSSVCIVAVFAVVYLPLVLS